MSGRGAAKGLIEPGEVGCEMGGDGIAGEERVELISAAVGDLAFRKRESTRPIPVPVGVVTGDAPRLGLGWTLPSGEACPSKLASGLVAQPCGVGGVDGVASVVAEMGGRSYGEISSPFGPVRPVLSKRRKILDRRAVVLLCLRTW